MVIPNKSKNINLLNLLQSAKRGKVVSPWRYPGGKSHVMKTHILPFIRKMNKSNEYNDPFAGGGCIPIALAKEFPTMRFRLNDKNPAMAEYWRIIAAKAEPEILYQALETPMSFDVYEHVVRTNPENPQMRVYRALVLNRINWNGVASANPSKDFLARYNAKETTLRIRALRILFKDRLEVFNLDVLDFLKIIGPKTFVFLDPPYWEQGKNLYPTFMKPIEHKRLANALKEIGSWIMTYDACMEIKRLYSWAHLAKFWNRNKFELRITPPRIKRDPEKETEPIKVRKKRVAVHQKGRSRARIMLKPQLQRQSVVY